MGFHICIVGYGVDDTSITPLEDPPNHQIIFVLDPTSTNPKLLHVQPVNAAASRASSLRLRFIIRSNLNP